MFNFESGNKSRTDTCMSTGYMGGGTIDEKLKVLYIRYRRWCKKHRIPYCRKLFSARLLCINPSSPQAAFPCLTQRVKAAYCKTLIHYLAFATNKYLAHKSWNDDRAEVRATMCYGLAKACWVMDHADVLFSAAEVSEITLAGGAYIMGYLKLAEMCIAAQPARRLYKVRPKLHYQCHQLGDIVKNAENISIFSNFADEDLVGRVAKISRLQHRRCVMNRTVEVFIMLMRRNWRRFRAGLLKPRRTQ